MASYVKPSGLLSDKEKYVYISSVVAGDQIDFIEIFGRPARWVRITADDTTDVITLRLNNKIRFKTNYSYPPGIAHLQEPADTSVVSEGVHYPLLSYTASEAYDIDDLDISFLQIDGIVFGSGGTGITVEAK